MSTRTPERMRGAYEQGGGPNGTDTYVDCLM